MKPHKTTVNSSVYRILAVRYSLTHLLLVLLPRPLRRLRPGQPPAGSARDTNTAADFRPPTPPQGSTLPDTQVLPNTTVLPCSLQQ